MNTFTEILLTYSIPISLGFIAYTLRRYTNHIIASDNRVNTILTSVDEFVFTVTLCKHVSRLNPFLSQIINTTLGSSLRQSLE